MIRMKKGWNFYFQQITKSIQTEAVFTKTEMDNKWNVILLEKASTLNLSKM